MPARQVAFLRGVNNIGMAKRVSMAELRQLFENLGFADVRTVLNSGNVVFSATEARRAAVLARIKEGLAAQLGVRCSVIVLSGRDVIAVVRDNPLARMATDPSRLLVVVPQTRADLQAVQPLLRKRWGAEKLAIGRRVAYLWCADGVGESELWPAVDRALERSATARNIGTMTRLMRLLTEQAP